MNTVYLMSVKKCRPWSNARAWLGLHILHNICHSEWLYLHWHWPYLLFTRITLQYRICIMNNILADSRNTFNANMKYMFIVYIGKFRQSLFALSAAWKTLSFRSFFIVSNVFNFVQYWQYHKCFVSLNSLCPRFIKTRQNCAGLRSLWQGSR